MTSRPHSATSSRTQRTTQVLGHSPFFWPNGNGAESCFQLTTHVTGRTSLRHVLSGLKKIESEYRQAELVQVNQIEVNGWSHDKLVWVLNQHLARLTDDELKLTLRARDSQGRRHIIEVVINVIYEDGVSLGDKVREAYDIIVRATDKIVTTPDVTDVTFENSYYIRIRHNAQMGFFLKGGSDNTMCMDIPSSESDHYVFKCYSFIGHNEKAGGGGGGGEEGAFPKLCVLQHPPSGRFVAACPTSGCLTLDEDESFTTRISSISSPDRHFFILHDSGNGGSETFCLRPLIMPNYYLRYDAVKGLRLKKCVPPPYKRFDVVRFFSFDFMPANDSSH